MLDLDATFPLINFYQLATGSLKGAIGLAVVAWLANLFAMPDCLIAAGRTYWALSRDGATPCHNYFAKVDHKLNTPLRCNILCAIITTLVGCIYVGSETAFNAFISSFVILTTVSYGIPVAANMATGRKLAVPGPFNMGKFGWFVNVVTVLYICVSVVFFVMPFSLPVHAADMNYTVLVLGAFVIFITIWWLAYARKNYTGPSYIPQLLESVDGLVVAENENVAK